MFVVLGFLTSFEANLYFRKSSDLWKYDFEILVKKIVRLKCLLKIIVQNLLGDLEQLTSLGFSLLFYFHLVDHVESHFTLRNQWPWMHTRWFLSKYLGLNGNSLEIIYFPLLLRANQRLQMFLNVATLMPLLLPMNIDWKLIG